MAAPTDDEKANNQTKIMKANITIKWEDIKSTRRKAFKPKTSKRSKEIQIDTQHDSKDEVEEKKNKYEYADFDEVHGAGGAIGMLTGAAGYLVGHVAKGFVEGAVLHAIGVEVATAAGWGIAGCYIGGGVSIAPYLAHTGYTYWCNKAEERTLETKQKYNAEVKLYNTRLEELNKIASEVEVLQKKLQEQEDKINNKTWQIERHGPYTKLVVAVGPTGYGKSLVCNRLLGDKRNIFDLAQTKTAMFDVAEFGVTTPITKDLSKKSKRVIITVGTGKFEKQFMLSVVDTQGAFDPDDDDKHFLNEMKEYFIACGGVNMFCLFFKFGAKIDSNYKKLMELYAKFWGERFWGKCVVIVTNCDTDSKNNRRRLEIGYKTTEQGIRKDLQEVTRHFDKIPIYQYGEENFESSTIELLCALQNPQLPYEQKHKCNDIKSPMDELWDKIRPKLRQIRFINKELDTLDKKMAKAASKISK